MSNVDILNKSMELIIMPTEHCDLDCVYCYEDHLSIGSMSSETYSALKFFVSNRIPELERLHIGWFGGEPLLKYNMMLDFMGYLAGEKSRRNPQLVISSGMTTNAYRLTGPRLECLVGAGINGYQITFDGDKKEHDSLRIRRDGSGTFDTIWANVKNAHNTDKSFQITVRLHVNSGNSDSIKRFIDRFLRDIGMDKRFSMLIKPLGRLGGKNDAKLPIVENGETVENLVQYVREHGITGTTDDPNYVCYASKPNSFVIRANGSINKCTVALYADHNNVGRLLRDGKVKIDIDKFRGWIRGLESGSIEELGCPAKNYPVLKKSLSKKISLNVLA